MAQPCSSTRSVAAACSSNGATADPWVMGTAVDCIRGHGLRRRQVRTTVMDDLSALESADEPTGVGSLCRLPLKWARLYGGRRRDDDDRQPERRRHPARRSARVSSRLLPLDRWMLQPRSINPPVPGSGHISAARFLRRDRRCRNTGLPPDANPLFACCGSGRRQCMLAADQLAFSSEPVRHRAALG